MSETAGLGDFLKTRRSQLRPDAVGVPSYGERRRVPRLRREELARLANASVSYYTRFEMRHPLIGPPTVTQRTPSTGTGPSIVVATAPHGSPPHTALAPLARATTSIPPYSPVNRVSTT